MECTELSINHGSSIFIQYKSKFLLIIQVNENPTTEVERKVIERDMLVSVSGKFSCVSMVKKLTVKAKF